MPLQRPPPLFTSLSSSCWITTELPEWLLFKPPVFLQCRFHAVSTQISKMHSSSYTFKSLRGPSTARRNRWPCGPSCSRALSCDPNALFRLLPDSAPACSLRLNQPDFYILPIDTLPRPFRAWPAAICTRSLASSLAVHSTCVSSFVLQSIFQGQELVPHAPVRHSLSTGCRRVNQEETEMPHFSDSRSENIPVACEHWCGRLTARGETAAGSFGVGQKDRQFHRQRTS